jgi:hypothetical protein
MNLLMNNVVIIYMDYFRSLLTNSKKQVSATAPYTDATRINKNLDDINNWIKRIKKKADELQRQTSKLQAEAAQTQAQILKSVETANIQTVQSQTYVTKEVPKNVDECANLIKQKDTIIQELIQVQTTLKTELELLSEKYKKDMSKFDSKVNTLINTINDNPQIKGVPFDTSNYYVNKEYEDSDDEEEEKEKGQPTTLLDVSRRGPGVEETKGQNGGYYYPSSSSRNKKYLSKKKTKKIRKYSKK